MLAAAYASGRRGDVRESHLHQRASRAPTEARSREAPPDPAISARRLGPTPGPSRSDRGSPPAGGAPHPGAGADPPPADERVAVHVPPWGGGGDGPRPSGHPDDGYQRAGLRRRSPPELWDLRLAGAPA